MSYICLAPLRETREFRILAAAAPGSSLPPSLYDLHHTWVLPCESTEQAFEGARILRRLLECKREIGRPEKNFPMVVFGEAHGILHNYAGSFTGKGDPVPFRVHWPEPEPPPRDRSRFDLILNDD